MSASCKCSARCAATPPDNPDYAPSLYREICDNLFDGVYFVDKDRKISYWNHSAELLTGYGAEEVLGSQCFDNLLMHVDDAGSELCQAGCPLSATIQDGKRREAEVYLRHKAGHRVPVSVRVAPMTDASGTIIGAVEVFSDISTKKAVERRAKDLEIQAYCDPLTLLPNRRYMTMALQHTVQEIDEFGTTAGLLLIDPDHFKSVNDRFGHTAGDVVLTTLAQTLAHVLRPQDIAGRWGGDEFLLLAKGVDFNGLERIGERCRKLIEMSAVQCGDQRVPVTVSIGGTLLQPGMSSQAAFDRADSQLLASKALGRNRTVIAALG